MLIVVPDVLDAAQLAQLDELLAAARFADGGATARAAGVKRNQQLQRSEARDDLPGRVIAEALLGNATVRSVALPRSIRHPVIARYGPGMRYGSHVDEPVMTGGTPARSDIACTVFLSDPDEYDGGELVVDIGGAERVHRGERGSAVLYPADTLHRVGEVIRGERRVAVTWIQSLVRSAGERRVLYELERARVELTPEKHGTQLERLASVRARLLRAWAEL